MARIYKLDIKNFRGIKEFSYTFDDLHLICLVGRGDTGKSTILSAISYVLYPKWNPSFYDTDFYNCNTDNPVEIEATLVNVPEILLTEDKYGLYIRGINKETGEIKDEIEDEHEKALTIKLEVKKDLEPKWYIINGRKDVPIAISANDRAKLNTFIISDYLDVHFQWSKGSPLYSLLKQEDNIDVFEKDSILTDVMREAKNKIDGYQFNQFENVIKILKSKGKELGVGLPEVSNSIDFKDISIKEGKISLHEGKIPFRLKGKGTKRLMSIAIQLALVESGGIILIDEIEQGLEPDRIKHLVRTLYKNNKGQIFIATHSQNVIEELDAENILIVENLNGALRCKRCDGKFQDVIRACPEAAYAKKVIVCEGKTEIGICCALNDFRIKESKPNLSEVDTVYILGGGNNFVDRALKLKELSLEVCVFCDSDVERMNERKDELKQKGINVFDWDVENSTEQQVFNDLPWEAIKELIEYLEAQLPEASVRNSLNSRMQGELTGNWKENDTVEIRKALAEAAKNSNWFKRIDHGKFLGKIIFKHFDYIKDKTLGKRLENLSNWIDNE